MISSVGSRTQVEDARTRRDLENVDLTAAIKDILDYVITEATSDLDPKIVAVTVAKGQQSSHNDPFHGSPLLPTVVETTIETFVNEVHSAESLEVTEPDFAQADIETIGVDSSSRPQLSDTPNIEAEEHEYQIEGLAKTEVDFEAKEHDASNDLPETGSPSAAYKVISDENAFEDSGIFVGQYEEAQLNSFKIENSCITDHKTTSETGEEYQALEDSSVLPLIKLRDAGRLPDGRRRAHSLLLVSNREIYHLRNRNGVLTLYQLPSTTLFLGQLRLDMQTLSLAARYQGTELDYLIDNSPLSTGEEDPEGGIPLWNPCDYSENPVVPVNDYWNPMPNAPLDPIRFLWPKANAS